MADLKIINANVGKTNVVSFEAFHENSIKTLKDIIETILPMCGPNALTDLVITRQSSGNYMGNIFSNDGIHLLKSISYVSPIQTYIADYIRYIAERVESAAADGTSTAIYFAANLLITLLDEVARKRKLNDTLTTSIEKTRVMMNHVQHTTNLSKYLINTLLFSLENMKIDVKTADLELKKKIISRLAYTTSKGNKLLTQYASDLFVNLPEELYEHISYKRLDRETEDDFVIDNPDYDALVNIVPSASVQYNSKLNTELLWEECDLLVCPNIYESGLFVNEYMKQRVAGIYGDSSKPIVILYTGANDQDIIGLEKIIDGHKAALCRHTVYTQAFINNPLELNIIQALGNINPHRQLSIEEVELSIIRNVKCRIYGNELYIHKLFVSDNSYLHPSYVNNDHPEYNKLRNDIETELKRLKSSHGKDIVRSNLNELTRLYRLLVCSRLPILNVGGSTVNHLANINVVDDVLGVVSVAMKHGVIIDMVPKLYHVIRELINNSREFGDDRNKWIETFNRSIADFAQLTYNCKTTDKLLIAFDEDDIEPNINMTGMDDTPRHYPIAHDMRFYARHNDTWFSDLEEFTEHIQVVQSYKAIHETLTRLLETIPKLINTDKIIVIDGVMDTK